MRDLSNYRAKEDDGEITGPSDLQWLEDGINFIGAWMKGTLFPSKEEEEESEMTIAKAPGNKPGKIIERKPTGKRKIIRAREREVEIIIED